MWNISANFSLGRRKKRAPFYIQSFLYNDKVTIRLQDKSVQYTIGNPVLFNLDTIEEDIDRYHCIIECNELINKHPKNYSLLVYYSSDIAPIIQYMINNQSYTTYQLFTTDREIENSSRYLEKKGNVFINSSESNLSSLCRIIQNEYEHIMEYDSKKNIRLLVLSSSNTIEELCAFLNWHKDCYVCMPNHKLAICAIRYFYRYDCIVDKIACAYGYCILKIRRNTDRQYTTKDIVKKVKEWYNYIMPKLRPMKS